MQEEKFNKQDGNLVQPNVSGIYSPSELIALKKYYDAKWMGGSSNGGCRTQENIDAEKISKQIEKRLLEMANNLR